MSKPMKRQRAHNRMHTGNQGATVALMTMLWSFLFPTYETNWYIKPNLKSYNCAKIFQIFQLFRCLLGTYFILQLMKC